VRLVVADDSAVVRDGLRHLLDAHGHTVVATAGDGTSLVDAVVREQPDIALIDIRMPPDHTTEGLVAAATIRTHNPGTGILVLSQHVETDYALTLLREHPSRCGYLLKDRVTQIDTLLDAIARVGAGGTVVDRELVELLLHRPGTQDTLAKLTEREREVLALLAEGLTDRGIAQHLWLTPKTVETHVRHILAKLALPPDTHHNRRVLAVLTYLRTQAADTQRA
jgi:DNA-binding NarL/FixJ family response regulator